MSRRRHGRPAVVRCRNNAQPQRDQGQQEEGEEGEEAQEEKKGKKGKKGERESIREVEFGEDLVNPTAEGDGDIILADSDGSSEEGSPQSGKVEDT